MRTRDHHELFRYLMGEYCLLEEEITYVENVAEWCAEKGIEEPDRQKPLKVALKTEAGCKLLVREDIPERVVDERLKALSVRSALLNVATDRAELLNSERKKLAYLFLHEYAGTFPDSAHDDLLADNWAFEEMERMGFFKE